VLQAIAATAFIIIFIYSLAVTGAKISGRCAQAGNASALRQLQGVVALVCTGGCAAARMVLYDYEVW
jgi:hypothetical protein